jgi:hypothetical protein
VSQLPAATSTPASSIRIENSAGLQPCRTEFHARAADAERLEVGWASPRPNQPQRLNSAT